MRWDAILTASDVVSIFNPGGAHRACTSHRFPYTFTGRETLISMRPVSCEIDGSNDASFILQSPMSDGPLVRCRKCGLFYISPRINDYAFRDFVHEDRDTRNETLVAAAEIAFPDASVEVNDVRRRTFQQRLQRILVWRRSGSLLDVGCERGFFLEAARRHFEVYGVETNSNTAEQARRVGADVFNGTLREANYPDAAFDVVTAFHVIEHVDSPRVQLQEMFRILKPGGLLVVETPNIDNMWFRVFRSRWRQFIHDHYFFFDPRTMALLLKSVGFTPLEVSTIGKQANLHFLCARMGRYWRSFLPLAEWVRRRRINEVYFNVSPGDILIAFARKPGAEV